MERIDQDLPLVSPADAHALDDRIKNARVKPCNEFNLIGKCSMPDCKYDHERLLPEGERLAFARKTRTKICRLGSKCLNERCMYAHMCQLDAKRSCGYREGCHFNIFMEWTRRCLRSILLPTILGEGKIAGCWLSYRPALFET